MTLSDINSKGCNDTVLCAVKEVRMFFMEARCYIINYRTFLRMVSLANIVQL